MALAVFILKPTPTAPTGGTMECLKGADAIAAMRQRFERERAPVMAARPEPPSVTPSPFAFSLLVQLGLAAAGTVVWLFFQR